ncbi:MAG: hypothetical protein RMK01_11555 [Thermomicrobium sp.]|nr:hypothetical protein [Thermomicrobium sp.]
MSTIEQLRTFLAAIERHPERREELRRYVLTQELLVLPAAFARQEARLEQVERELAEIRDAVRALVASSQRHEEELLALRELAARQDERIAHIEGWLARLTALVERHHERLDRLETLAERHDERLDRLETLAERHDERLDQLTTASDEHSERLRRLEELAERHDKDLGQLRSAVASLSTTVGAMVEADAVDALLAVLEQKGLRAEELPTSVAVNGELDLVAPVTDEEGRRYWVVVEVKVQLHPRDIRTWLRRLQSEVFRARLAAQGIHPPFLAYVYGQRLYRPALETARELGVGVLSRRGEFVAPAGTVE